MPPFTIEGTTPVLLFGERDQVLGEVWFTNPTGADIKVTGASVLVNFAVPETGVIHLSSDAVLAAGATKRLAIAMGVQPFTTPGTYSAALTLNTSAGDQVVPASVMIASTLVPQLAPTVLTFTGVKKSTTISGSVVVLNKGNTAIVVGPIPDETLLEMVTIARVLAVGGAGSVSVQPALGLVPGGNITFTNTKPTIPPGGWANVDFKLTTPATLTADRHFRVLPRIATERFVVDLLT